MRKNKNRKTLKAIICTVVMLLVLSVVALPVFAEDNVGAAVREVIEDLPVQAMLRKPSKTHGHRQKHRSRRSLIMLCSLLWI